MQVATPGGPKWGFIDKGGTMIIQPQFDGEYDFCDGLAGVLIGGTPGGCGSISIVADGRKHIGSIAGRRW